MTQSAFLFVGFGLSDPNFNLLHDDTRLAYGMNVPASYTVQGRRNPVKERYLRSLAVNTIWLEQQREPSRRRRDAQLNRWIRW
jgi:SIR2-like protein